MPRPKIEFRTASKDQYQKFCEQYPDTKISFKTFDKIIRTYNELFRDYILATGEKVKMPWGIGAFSINKKKTLKYFVKNGKKLITLPIDWVKTRAAGKYVYNFNGHTDGYKFRWLWFERDAYFLHSQLWNFIPCRRASRLLASNLKGSESKKYVDMYHEWR